VKDLPDFQSADVPGVICLGWVPWDYLKLASQQTMREMTHHAPVLYVEWQRSAAGVLIEPRNALADIVRLVRVWRTPEPGLTVTTPPFAAPFRTRSFLANRLSMVLLRWWTRRLQRRLGWEHPVVWCYIPQGYMVRRAFDECCFVYDVIDEYSAFPNMDADLATRLDSETTRVADLVFAISPNLVDERRAYNERIAWAPIGAEADKFLAASKDDPAPPSLAGVPPPRVGYYGTLDDRIDYELCITIARRLAQVSFVYYGPVRRPGCMAELASLPNVHVPGPLSYDQLPAHAVHFDVCILPYVNSRFNRYIFPNKIFEYMATGNPVVVSPIPALKYLGDANLVTVAADPEAFVHAIGSLLENPARGRNDRREYAAANTWRRRADSMWQHVVAFLDEKR